MNKFNLDKKIIVSAASLMLLLSACGGSAYRTTSTAASSNPTTSGNTVPSATPSPTASSGVTVSAATDATANIQPSISLSFTVTGTSSYTSGDLSTDNLLKVKVTAGIAAKTTLANSNFSASYGCAKYKVSLVNSSGTVVQSVTTAMLAVPGVPNTNCASAPTNQVIDFSGSVTNGHRNFKVRVEAVGYDYYCQYWNACSAQVAWNGYTYLYLGGDAGCPTILSTPQNTYCPSHTVYTSHTVTGNLEVQVTGS